MINFWEGKRILLTGHTGFKGSWLCLWLNKLGAQVTGYSLGPPTKPSLFGLCRVDQLCHSLTGDVREPARLAKAMIAARPEIVFHLAAQAIVRQSYQIPVQTFSTNVMGTVNVLEAARQCASVKAVINVTTDKVYENSSQGPRTRGFREDEPLGGYDPYASSKACSELIAQTYRRSYGMNIATARAGNVIGGGDWAVDRLVPDFVRSLLQGQGLVIRNPAAVRPWQHVLDPLYGYLLLAEKLYNEPGQYAAAWNFGPRRSEAKPVEWLVKGLCQMWGDVNYTLDKGPQPHEAGFLTLDVAKAKRLLGWQAKWDLATALQKTVDWTKAYQAGADMREVSRRQIEEYAGE
jgi:CDP-glucose 4,6-dehydratase